MTLQLFGHPFSSYTMKALIALYENDTPFDFRILGSGPPCGQRRRAGTALADRQVPGAGRWRDNGGRCCRHTRPAKSGLKLAGASWQEWFA